MILDIMHLGGNYFFWVQNMVDSLGAFTCCFLIRRSRNFRICIVHYKKLELAQLFDGAFLFCSNVLYYTLTICDKDDIWPLYWCCNNVELWNSLLELQACLFVFVDLVIKGRNYSCWNLIVLGRRFASKEEPMLKTNFPS